jgi:hypothetical protein
MRPDTPGRRRAAPGGSRAVTAVGPESVNSRDVAQPAAVPRSDWPALTLTGITAGPLETDTVM